MKPSPAFFVSTWVTEPLTSLDGLALGWLWITGKSRSHWHSKVYLSAVVNFFCALSVNRMWRVVRFLFGSCETPRCLGLPPASFHPMPAGMGSNPTGLRLQQRRLLPGHQVCTKPPVSTSRQNGERALKNDAAGMKAAGGGFRRPFWKAENRKRLINLWERKKKKKKKKRVSFWAARMFVKSLLRLLWCWVSAGCFIKDSWDTLLAH